MVERYAIVTDDSVKWFDYLIRFNCDNKALNKKKIESGEVELLETISFNVRDLFGTQVGTDLVMLPIFDLNVSINQVNGFFGRFITRSMFEKVKYMIEGDEYHYECGTD